MLSCAQRSKQNKPTLAEQSRRIRKKLKTVIAMASPDVARVPLVEKKPEDSGNSPRAPRPAGREKKQVTFRDLGKTSQVRSKRYRGAGSVASGASGALSGDEEQSDKFGRKGAHTTKSSLRKRSYSFSEGNSRPGAATGSAATTGPPISKKWKHPYSRHHRFYHHKGALGKNVLPSKFLLGGNIRDPLNLNSLSDERISKIVNAVTPDNSPAPTPAHKRSEHKIEVLIPPNISDPLNLNSGVDENEYQSQLLISPGVKRKKKFRYRKRFRSKWNANNSLEANNESNENIETASEDENEDGPEGEKKKVSDQTASSKVEGKVDKCMTNQNNTEKPSPRKRPITVALKLQKNLKDSEIVSPVVPQPGQNKKDQFNKTKRNQSKNNHQTAKNSRFKKQANHKRDTSKGSRGKIKPPSPKPLPQRHRFEFGNYNRYYGYRNAGEPEADLRLRIFRREWFEGKDVLDIGCNVGLVSTAIARHFGAKSVIGMDIDQKLIEIARKNLSKIESSDKPDGIHQFPKSLSDKFGPVSPGLHLEDGANGSKFPKNVKFVCGNYVLENDELLDTCQQEFDVIMCLSTTKWIHLNFGDEGLKRTFKRIYAQLRPGGALILEAQGMASYRSKKRLTQRIYQNFQAMKLKPENFTYYLLHEVGFECGETIAVPNHSSKGFQRPLQLFIKRFPFSSRSASSRQTTPYLGPSPFGPSPFTSSRYGSSFESSAKVNRCYAPSMTPMYKPSPLYSGKESPANDRGSKKKSSHQINQADLDEAGPSHGGNYDNDDNDTFSRPHDPPEDSPAWYLGVTPNYSPGATPNYTGYSAYGPSGITPGYTGPSPEYPSPRSHSPVYSGPEPGALSNASTPCHNPDEDNYSGPGYTPHHPSYTPSNPGTPAYYRSPRTPPQYSPRQSPYSPRQAKSPSPLYSPGNATPKPGQGTPTDTSSSPMRAGNSGAGAQSISPQIQQPEVSGNTTPHPGPSSGSPQSGNPKYLWYGYSGTSSGSTTPQFVHSGPTSPQLFSSNSVAAPSPAPSPAQASSPAEDPNPSSPSVQEASEEQPPSDAEQTPPMSDVEGSNPNTPSSPGSPFPSQ